MASIKSLFEAIARDLEQKGACVRKSLPSGSGPRGTLIDDDCFGRQRRSGRGLGKAQSRAPAHGYQAHSAADKDTGIVREVETTAAN